MRVMSFNETVSLSEKRTYDTVLAAAGMFALLEGDMQATIH
jgi:hypothetical protein